MDGLGLTSKWPLPGGFGGFPEASTFPSQGISTWIGVPDSLGGLQAQVKVSIHAGISRYLV